MISKTWSRKPIAALLAVAILSVYSMVVLASPAAKAPAGGDTAKAGRRLGQLRSPQAPPKVS